ncbi:MAG: hypothetical protein MZV64_68050 [Ignavibacteriales bacterium]|nr:hypothetical protein [Ignavibacteriales bacterium]
MREKAGRPMTYTLAVVDEGLLGPDPLSRRPTCASSFYDREALGVRTWDLFDDVAEAYGAELSRLLALGGDERRRRPRTRTSKPRRFPPVVLFEGPFDLEAGGKTASTSSRCRSTSARCGSWWWPAATAPSARPRSRCRCART